ncbi:MAG: hypothetical protein A3I05_04020 [Deltaproteobacteria bacterium RIFCSPLOWO2_02_FULL_44_10]|nr:MAG: hypothetical protein A3C46_03825 [Deltaproteobacteria bacterium RIFCSPHIGHO2_02_FULL_44_16]OGQ46315.1 MAG: hypothetical protein A3I05_04020 [Deltaproteobacteria bacterium RIFCSPLOWO2_02_FULL_44_10]
MKTLLFLHGLDGSKVNFKYLEKELQGDFQIINFDLIGFGDEQHAQGTYDLDCFLEFIEKKTENISKPFTIVAHSFGGILAKEFTRKHAQRVEKVFLMGYPLADTEVLLKKTINKMFAHNALFGKILCETKIVWKYFLFPFFFLFWRKYFGSVQAYFQHSYTSESKTLQQIVLQDRCETLLMIKEKCALIFGEEDPLFEKKFASQFHLYVIKGMGHLFFGHEQKIATIIKNNSL